MLLLLMIFLPMAAAPVGWMIGRRSKRGRDALAIGVGFVELALALAAYFLRSSAGADLTAELGGICGLGLRLKYDGFRAVYCLVLSFMWAMTLLFSPDYFAHHHNRNRYYFFQLLTLGATMGVFLSADLYTAFVFFEIMSFTSFPWVIQEETAGAIRAAKTYLAVAVIGGLVALMGIFLLHARLGTLELDALYPAAQAAGKRPVFYTAAACILFGFGAKAGMFPLHIWLPKAHPVAPAPASALLSGALTKSGVWGILAVSCQLFRGDPAWGTVILALGTVTMLLGAVLALFSVDLKRTLACSSMSQIGFILVGVGMMGILGEENALAARGTVLHMVNHSVFKLVLFLCAGTVFRNLHQLDLNEIRGLGAMGIGGVPLLNGYVSKTLLHEGIVEGAHLTGSGWLTAVEWIFLFSGGLTAAYMTKLFVAVFVEKHPTRQAEFDGMKRYLSRPAALALGLSALVVPVLGLTADHTMNAVADLASDFLHGEAPVHAVHYLSAENLKGAAISIAIGAAVYGCVVRTGMMRRGVYLNRWPARLDLEDLVYRPLLLRILPGLFGWLCAFFGENRVTRLLAKGAMAAGSRLGAIFGENRVTGPAAKGLFAGTRTLSHALSDSLDALVVALQRTVFRQSAERRENKVADTVSYRLGEKLDRAAARLGGERAGRTRYAERLYRIRRTVRETGRQITGNLSFALLMLVLAICAVLAFVLLR